MRWKALKYCLPFFIYLLSIGSFRYSGFAAWVPVLNAFVLIPLLELFIRPAADHAAEGQITKDDPIYDWILYLMVPLQYGALAFFFHSIQDGQHSLADKFGHILTMGLLCGSFGINVAHELGHRSGTGERLLARSLLLTSLYMHFYIEHNRGHHKYVGTPQDPATAPYGQSIYRFWVRSISGVYKKAWDIASEEQEKKNRRWWQNEMLHYELIQAGFCLLIALVWGWAMLVYFLFAAFIGILLLEMVNYIEHYGLQRREISPGRFERAMPEHSWNSNHLIGRLLLFELSRHSDHHYLASRKYQALRHHEDAPQLPAGYPGSMLLALIPPLWFHIMNRRISNYTSAVRSLS